MIFIYHIQQLKILQSWYKIMLKEMDLQQQLGVEEDIYNTFKTNHIVIDIMIKGRLTLIHYLQQKVL